MKTVKTLLVLLLIVQIVTAVMLWDSIYNYPPEDEDEDGAAYAVSALRGPQAADCRGRSSPACTTGYSRQSH